MRCWCCGGSLVSGRTWPQVADALNRRRNIQGSRLNHPPSAYVTGLLVPQGGEIEVDKNVSDPPPPPPLLGMLMRTPLALGWVARRARRAEAASKGTAAAGAKGVCRG